MITYCRPGEMKWLDEIFADYVHAIKIRYVSSTGPDVHCRPVILFRTGQADRANRLLHRIH